MPETAIESTSSDPVRPPRAIISWWNQLHFSGRVIMSSVLFGFGLVLVGGLLLAINMNDDPSSLEEDHPNEIPTKAPSNIVGPVVMSIGAFVVVVGIMMCLFETQICRKRTSESSSLISEGKKELESTADVSVSASPQQENRERGVSSKHCKGHHSKGHTKKRNEQSLQSDSAPIESSKQFMTSSDDTFLTPTSTLSSHQDLLFSSPKDAANQNSDSSGFTSSGPWGQSTEFQTPCASFKDTSLSLNNSTEIRQEKDQVNTSSELETNVNLNSIFQTPVTPDEEKLQNMAKQIQNQKVELTD